MRTKRFDIGRQNFIGIGFRWSRWNEGWMFNLDLPFVWMHYCTAPTK